jgi:hypothetical protein
MGIIEEELEGSHYALAVNRYLIFYVIYVPYRSVPLCALKFPVEVL